MATEEMDREDASRLEQEVPAVSWLVRVFNPNVHQICGVVTDTVRKQAASWVRLPADITLQLVD